MSQIRKLLEHMQIIENFSGVPNMETILFLERNFIITRMKLISSDIFKIFIGYIDTVSHSNRHFVWQVVLNEYIIHIEIKDSTGKIGKKSLYKKNHKYERT